MAREILNKKEFYQLVNDFDLTEKEKTVYWKELSNGFFSSFEELSKHYQSPVKKSVFSNKDLGLKVFLILRLIKQFKRMLVISKNSVFRFKIYLFLNSI